MEKRGTGDERLAAICQLIRNETLDPAKEEAEQIKHAAERDAAHIRAEAKRHAEQMLHDARTLLKTEKDAFDASLEMTARHTVALLKEKVEHTLFNPAFDRYLSKELSDEKKTAHLLDLIIQGIEKEGLEGDLSIWLGKNLDREEVLKNICFETAQQIAQNTVFSGEHTSGLVVKITDRHLSIEITPQGLKELMAGFLRPDFRAMLFKE